MTARIDTSDDGSDAVVEAHVPDRYAGSASSSMGEGRVIRSALLFDRHPQHNPTEDAADERSYERLGDDDDDEEGQMNSPLTSAADPLSALSDANSSTRAAVTLPVDGTSSNGQQLSARQRLVERERQARLELQRAQALKRIALNNREAEEMEEAENAELNGIDRSIGGVGDAAGLATTLDELAGRAGSVVGTVGDASVHEDVDVDVDDHHDHEYEADGLPLGYAMERFLSEQVAVSDQNDGNGDNSQGEQETDSSSASITNQQGRRLDDATAERDRDHNRVQFQSPSLASAGTEDFDVGASLPDGDIIVASPARAERAPSFDASLSRRSDTTSAADSTMDFSPRLARLTETESLEIDEVDYASVGNVPPRSVRDEDEEMGAPFIGQMGSSFAGTQTTTLETNSIPSAEEYRQSLRSQSEASRENGVLLTLSPGGNSDRNNNHSVNSPDGDRSSRVSSPEESLHSGRCSRGPPRNTSFVGNLEEMDNEVSGTENFVAFQDYDHETSLPRLVLDSTNLVVASPAAATLGEFADDTSETSDRLDCPLLEQEEYHDYGATDDNASPSHEPNRKYESNIETGGVPREVLLERNEPSLCTGRTNGHLHSLQPLISRWRKTEVGLAYLLGLAMGFLFGIALSKLDWSSSPFLSHHEA